MMGKYFVDETETKTFMNAVFLLTAKQSLWKNICLDSDCYIKECFMSIFKSNFLLNYLYIWNDNYPVKKNFFFFLDYCNIPVYRHLKINKFDIGLIWQYKTMT